MQKFKAIVGTLVIFFLILAGIGFHLLGWTQPYAPAATQAAAVGNGFLLFAVFIRLGKTLHE